MSSNKGQASKPFNRLEIAVSKEAISIVERTTPSRLAYVIVHNDHEAGIAQSINDSFECTCNRHVQYLRVVFFDSVFYFVDVETVEDVTYGLEGVTSEHVDRPSQAHAVVIAADDLIS